MSETLPRPPQGDREPLFWRAIPLNTPPFRHALVVTCLALAVGLGLRLVVLGFPVGFGASSTWNPPHDLPRQGMLALFGLSSGVTVVAASALRTALVRLRGAREPPRERNPVSRPGGAGRGGRSAGPGSPDPILVASGRTGVYNTLASFAHL